MKIVFVADFFREDIGGGAESNDSALISFLASRFDLLRKRSHEIDNQWLEDNKDNFFIFGNFVNLSSACIDFAVDNLNYIIYEHDHKYIRVRNPSMFKNFKIPTDQLCHVDFYKRARKVIVLSKVCKEVLEDNLTLNNVISIGTSIWEPTTFDEIERLSTNAEHKGTCVLESENRVKGMKQATQYCRENGVKYDLISSASHFEFLERLSKYEKLVFFPQVLETFCRLVAEAKMLGLKVVTTPKLLGFASEGFGPLSGLDLVEELRKRSQAAKELFVQIIEEESASVTEDITVILNAYRRPEHLKEQISAIKRQSVTPREIWLWVNDHQDNRDVDFSELGVDRIFKNDHNWKYYGRFCAALMARTKYLAFFDDDTIPGHNWFKNCLETPELENGILGGVGVLLKEARYYGHDRVGWSSHNEDTIEVDLVGHAWFFKKEVVKYLWHEEPYMWDNGEDIQLSYTAQKYGRIRTYVPPHPAGDLSKHSSIKGYEYGVDDKASSHTKNHSKFYAQRDSCVQNALRNGWETVKGIKL